MAIVVKKRNIVLLVVSFIFCFYFQSCTKVRLEEGQEGTKKYQDQKTGVQFEYQYKVVNGKVVRHGSFKSINDSGKYYYRLDGYDFIFEVNYILGKKEGSFEAYWLKKENGKKFPVEIGSYKNDLLDGEYKCYSYKDESIAKNKSYDSEEGFYKNGYKQGVWKTYYKDKLLSTEELENGLLNGPRIVYAWNKIHIKYLYKHSEIQKIEYYDENENVHSTINYKNGKPFEGIDFQLNPIKFGYNKITYLNGKIIKTESNFDLYGVNFQKAIDKRNELLKKAKDDQIEFAKSTNRSIILKHELRMNFILVPPGDFVVGGPVYQAFREKDERLCDMKVKKGFYLSETEVVQEVWEKVMNSNPSFDKSPNRPVTNVSWVEVNEFIKKANKDYKCAFRLPTEIEWEYACRAGSNEIIYGEKLEDIAVFSANNALFGHHDKVSKVKTKNPNQWGFYDMLGNVYEWCLSDFIDYDEYKGLNQIFSKNDLKVIRGGSYAHNPQFLRMSDRESKDKSYQEKNLGFRLLLEIE